MKLRVQILLFVFSIQQAYAQNLLIDSLFEVIENHKGYLTEVDALNELGNVYHREGNYDSSLLFHHRALSLATLRSNSNQISDACKGISVNLLWQAKYDSAKLYLSKAEAVARKIKDYPDLAGIYNSLGNILLQEGSNTEALRYYIRSAKIQDSIVHEPLGQSRALANIANIEYKMGNFEKALSYATEAQVISSKNKLNKNLAYTSQLIGRIFRKQGKLNEALLEYEKALTQYLSMGLKREACETYLSIGNIYFDKNDFINAQKSYKIAIEVSKDISNDATLGIIYSAIGITYQNLKNYKSAIAYMDSAFMVGKKINDQYTIRDSYDVLSQIYASQNMYKESLSYFHKFTNLKDSINQSGNKGEIEELEMKYQNEKKVAEIELLKSEQALQTVLLSKQRGNLIIAILILISVIVISVLLVNRYRVIGRSKRLVEMERMRNNIARDLHDDIGSTLSSINIISQLALKDYNGQSTNHFQRIHEHSSRIMESMSDIVWSINPQNDTFQQMLAKMKEFAAEILEPKDINYRFVEGSGITNLSLDSVRRKNLFLIFKEAINNTAKYSEGTEVIIEIQATPNTLKLLVRDNGRGFDEALVKSGNGLKNMETRASSLNGKLKRTSVIGKGTEIDLELPIT